MMFDWFIANVVQVGLPAGEAFNQERGTSCLYFLIIQEIWHTVMPWEVRLKES